MVLTLGLFAETEKPNLAGSWELDAAKSKIAHAGSAIELAMQELNGKIQLTRTVRPSEGKEVISKFECTAGGPDCAFDEAGHKSKVSVWFQGAELVILKTEGAGGDEVSQWNLKMVDKDTIQVTVSHITPAGDDETMVFCRKK